MRLPRIRTIREALREIKEADPNTAITESYLRAIIPRLPGTVKSGNRWLFSLDALEAYLADPLLQERERAAEYEEARQSKGIRPVGGGQ